jgi:hypothetical protein
MHQQFSTLDAELQTYGQNQEVRQRIKERYGGFTLASLVCQLEDKEADI